MTQFLKRKRGNRASESAGVDPLSVLALGGTPELPVILAQASGERAREILRVARRLSIPISIEPSLVSDLELIQLPEKRRELLDKLSTKLLQVSPKQR